MWFSKILFCLSGFVCLNEASYVLKDDYTPSKFFSMFTFDEAHNPVNGFAKYVNQKTAQNSGIISQDGKSVYIGVDHTNRAPHGRQSVRLFSKKVYNKGLFILDLSHMPAGCGTWPAFWMLGPHWPRNGEIDILEGVDEQRTNSMTLHTGPNCSINKDGQFTGSLVTSNCSIHDPHQSPNAGCSINADKRNTYGAGLNAADGGVYATEWTSDAISIFFFPRGSIPKDVSCGSPNPQSWSKPLAKFQGHCNIDDNFKNQQIILNTAFCGNWANYWQESSCASKAPTCHAFVDQNPSAFAKVFWKITSLKVYQDSDKS